MNDKSRDNLLFVICWLFAITFLWTFFAHTGFPPACPVGQCDWNFLLLALLFVTLPFVSKIKIGKLLEIERELKKSKDDLTEYKQSTNQLIQTISNSVSAVANLHNTININMPGNKELLEAKQAVETAVGPTSRDPASAVRAELLHDRTDMNDALFRARRRLEGLMRDILGKKSSFVDADQKTKYLGLYRLFDLFVREYPQYRELMVPFADINNVLNAATHAQKIPDSQAETTLDIAADLIAALEQIKK